MSCRATPGNSAITSYARLAASGEVTDQDVQQAFHDLKRAHAATTGPNRPHPGEIIGFLDHQAFLVRNDPTLSQTRRASLLERLSKARSEVESATNSPDLATFRAWQSLVAEVEMRSQGRSRSASASASAPRVEQMDRLRSRLG